MNITKSMVRLPPWKSSSIIQLITCTIIANHTVLLPKLKFEKVKVGIKANTAIVTNEELEQKGQIPVSFDGLHTWASLYNGRLSVKAEASNIRKVGMK